jgi:putative oxidoreductase
MLWLRVAALLPLFLKHGIEKIVNFSYMSQHFADPIGIGIYPTFIIAFISDAICSILVMLGICTRWVALFMFCSLFVGWSLRWHFMFWVRANWHGEMMVIYMAAIMAIVIVGPGKYSVDALIQKRLNRA